jgi:uncharacterized protein YndB with AHSA1/START domain
MSKTAITAEPGIPMIIVTREFDAPRDLVFRAHTDPDLLVQCLGPRDLTTTIDRYEARNGGTWRYLQTDAEGNTYGFHGVFHGEPSPDGIVQTFEFEGASGHVCLQTATRWSPPAWSAVSTIPASAWPSCSPGCRQADLTASRREQVGDLAAAVTRRWPAPARPPAIRPGNQDRRQLWPSSSSA